MPDIQMVLKQTIEREQEASDEADLQLTAVTIVDNVVSVSTQTIALKQLQPADPSLRWLEFLRPSLDQIPVASVSREYPYFAYVIRAIERDNSSSTNRVNDLADFESSIQRSAQRAVDERRVPTVNDIWLGGNAAELRDRWWKDDDDKIGVSARTHPDYGIILEELERVSTPPSPGYPITGSVNWTELFFGSNDASWRVEVFVSALP